MQKKTHSPEVQPRDARVLAADLLAVDLTAAVLGRREAEARRLLLPLTEVQMIDLFWSVMDLHIRTLELGYGSSQLAELALLDLGEQMRGNVPA